MVVLFLGTAWVHDDIRSVRGTVASQFLNYERNSFEARQRSARRHSDYGAAAMAEARW
jgi:hypothetical protein